NQTYRHTFVYYPRPGASGDQERTASKPARAPAAPPPPPQSPDPASAAAAGTPPTEPAPASPDADQIQPRS
ncbi:MAG TPA: hypothetical protein VIZ30_08125, partial [Pseudomonadales bacterium]